MAKRKRKLRTIETDIFGYPVAENPINSNRKGKDNERTAAKWLSLWVGKPFTRVPSSGGLRWQGTANVCGDVVCEDSDYNFPFTVETKHLKRIVFTEVLRSNSRVFSVYDQCKEDCERSGKKPMLMLRKDGMGTGKYIIFFEMDIVNALERIGLRYKYLGKRGSLVIAGYDSDDLLGIKFVDLIENL